MLGAGGLCDGQFLVHLSEETLVLRSEELHDGDPCRVAKRPGVTRQTLLLVGILVVCHLIIFVRKYTNNFQKSNKQKMKENLSELEALLSRFYSELL